MIEEHAKIYFAAIQLSISEIPVKLADQLIVEKKVSNGSELILSNLKI